MHIDGDWFERTIPDNVIFEDHAYPDTAYSFVGCRSDQPVAFRLGFASGNYGHGIFEVGPEGVVEVGSFVVLQSTRILCQRSVKIGDHCMFSWGSVVTDSWVAPGSSPSRVVTRSAARSSQRAIVLPETSPVVIDDNVWVGFGAVILPGVTIGRGAVVGCNTVVGENIEPYAVVVGNPARQVRTLNPTDSDEFRRRALEEFGISDR